MEKEKKSKKRIIEYYIIVCIFVNFMVFMYSSKYFKHLEDFDYIPVFSEEDEIINDNSENEIAENIEKEQIQEIIKENIELSNKQITKDKNRNQGSIIKKDNNIVENPTEDTVVIPNENSPVKPDVGANDNEAIKKEDSIIEDPIQPEKPEDKPIVEKPSVEDPKEDKPTEEPKEDEPTEEPKEDKPIEDPEEDDETEVILKVFENSKNFDELQTLNIFDVEEKIDGLNIIYPGIEGKYDFEVKNEGSNVVKYNLEFIENCIKFPNMKYYIVRNGVNLTNIDDQYYEAEIFDLRNLVINGNATDKYTLYWKWVDDDENDVKASDKINRAKYELKIHAYVG